MFELLSQSLILIPFLSFASCLILQFIFYKFSIRNNSAIPIITTTLIFLSAIASIVLCYDIFQSNVNPINYDIFTWISINNYNANFSVYISKFSSLMMVLVTSVSALVHLYSISYMQEEEDYSRFMINISFFTFCMSCLVLSGNFLQMFFGWEGVGLSSYLLINYYNKKFASNLAAIKAFLVNRFADIFMFLALGLIFAKVGSLDFTDIEKSISHLMNLNAFWGLNYLDLIAISLFIGCMGKSAQFLFHIWLPDAMQGPTPISALMHAATMVTAGVFLICKCSFIFENSQIASDFILIIASITALFAAILALVQTDIKRIIAYSTCSQLGYMFMAAGVSFYSGSFLHLLTHGFFKALLFLCAGGVIARVHHNQDIMKMPRNLYKKMPITFIAMAIGTLTICGIPPLSGFYSKDIIIIGTGVSGSIFGDFAFFIANFVVFLTSFYSFRLLFLTFFSKNQSEDVHDVDWKMYLPFGILSVISIYAGYFFVSDFGFFDATFAKNLINSDKNIEMIGKIHNAHHSHLPLMLSVFGAVASGCIYLINVDFKDKVKRNTLLLHRMILNKLYFDELYSFIFIRPYKLLAKFVQNKIDFPVINFILVSGPSGILFKASNHTGAMQNGKINNYTLISFVAIVVLILSIL